MIVERTRHICPRVMVERIGEYRIVSEHARTAVSITYHAVHAVLPRRVVLKVMTSATHRIAVRALREAFYLDTMDHPGAPRLYESALLPDRRPWFARELVEGPALASLFTRKHMDPMDVLERVRDLAEVLAHAHGHGIVHTGLRPDRVVLARRPRGFVLCVTDWSDARAHDAQPTPFASAPGAWHYAAPEVVIGDVVDDRADVFSLGVIAYKLLTGNLPFERGAIQMRNDGAHQIPALVAAPEAPPELCATIDQMLAYDRWDRPSSTEVFKDTSWLAEALASTRMRFRQPRWTPQIEVVHPEALVLPVRDTPREIVASLEGVIVSGEIALSATISDEIAIGAPTQKILEDAPAGALEAALLSLADAEVDDEYAEVEISGPVPRRDTDAD
ncbi:MAG: serine/threonine-protein kinase [Kofleriaceae bacterium]